MDYKEEYKKWCTSPVFDAQTKQELAKIQEDEEEIKDRFYKTLEFGTAGLRGVIGVGTNRMNKYTVGKATQGLANFIKKEKAEEKGVVIAYDSRHMSKEFSEETALCLNANGIKTYVFESLRPVPELSFAVRKLKVIAGIVITASHNPPEYNGYKVYWEDGAQIVSPKDKQIIAEVNAVTDYAQIQTISKEEAVKQGLYHVIGKEIDDAYMEELKKLVLNPEAIQKEKDMKIVYTPLHGTGKMPVQRILSELGFTNVFVVKEQEEPNGDFPTVKLPNPEDKAAFAMALELAQKENADIVLATDPDADRLGVYAKNSKTGEYMPFTGNMSGLLIAEYILSQKKGKGILPENATIIKTIVSSNLAEAIAKEYNIHVIEVLTGFKYIGEQIKLLEQTNKYSYQFGYEESYGCLIGTYARDKDAISAVAMLCEAAAYYKAQGLTLWDQMLRMYEKYGYYKEGLFSITLKGADGAEKIKQMMEMLRNSKIEKIGENTVIAKKDYQTQEGICYKTGEKIDITLPKSNVLYYDLQEDGWVAVRPSGTEPKIKFYTGVKGKSMEDAEKKLISLTKAIQEMVQQ